MPDLHFRQVAWQLTNRKPHRVLFYFRLVADDFFQVIGDRLPAALGNTRLLFLVVAHVDEVARLRHALALLAEGD